MMDPFQNNMATQFGRFRILFRKSFIENVYINILKNIFFCNSFYLIIFLNTFGVFLRTPTSFVFVRHVAETAEDTSEGQCVYILKTPRPASLRLAGRSCLRQLVSLEKKKKKKKKKNLIRCCGNFSQFVHNRHKDSF